MQGGWTEREKERYTKETARVKPKLKITQTKNSPTVDSLGLEDREVQSLWEIHVSLTEVRAPECPLRVSDHRDIQDQTNWM